MDTLPELFDRLHPMLSGFPGVLVVVVVLLEGWGGITRSRATFQPVIRSVLVILVLIVPVTYFSGLFARNGAEDAVPGGRPEVPLSAFDDHALAARVVLLTAPVTVLLFFLGQAAPESRRGLQRSLGMLYACFLAILLGAVIVTGHRGGELVFRHGVGVLPAGRASTESGGYP